MKHINPRDMNLIAACISILFVQEQVLSFIPNVQFSALLIFVYSKCLGLSKTSIIVSIHVLLDNMFMGSIGMPNIVIPMFIAWMIIPVMFGLGLRKINNIVILSIIGYLFGHVYGLVYVPFQAWLLNVDVHAYLIADIPFEIIMGISNFCTIFWLYEPLVKLVNSRINVKEI